MNHLISMFETADEAREAADRLKEAGITWDAISLAFRVPEDEDVPELMRDRPAGAGVGAVSGAGIGALLGLAVVGSTIQLPKVGKVHLSGPLAAALAGAALGAASGSLIGALVGAGVPEDDADAYLRKIEDGKILLSVEGDSASTARARKILLQSSES